MQIRKRDRDEERGLAPADHPFVSLREAMSQLFNESFWDPFAASQLLADVPTASYPRVDVSEDEKAVVVTADVPGMDPDNIEISVDEDSITLAGTMEKEEKEEDKKKRYYRYERAYGEFRRTIPLPARVDADSVSAKAKDGVLTITLPKAEEAKKKKVKVERE